MAVTCLCRGKPKPWGFDAGVGGIPGFGDDGGSKLNDSGCCFAPASGELFCDGLLYGNLLGHAAPGRRSHKPRPSPKVPFSMSCSMRPKHAQVDSGTLRCNGSSSGASRYQEASWPEPLSGVRIG